MYSAPLDTALDVLEFFNDVHSFIDEALENGKNVMVHCLAGAHRAGTTGVSYMMRAGKMSFNEALRVAKT
jgi:protein-tyrosine phosphatase